MPDLTPPGQQNTDKATLLVNGKEYDGWLTFSILRSMEAPTGTFTLTISDRWPGQKDPWPIVEGDECQLNLGKEPLVTGYVDTVSSSVSGTERTLEVSGRDKSCDLVDCSYVDKPDQWQGATVSAIAADLAKPYGVEVTMDGKDSTVENFKIEPGEKAYDAMARLLKLKGLYAWPAANGGITIGASEFESLKITLDQTQCLNVNSTRNAIERFSDYIVKGQRPPLKAGADPDQGKARSQVKDEASDPDVKRYRPLMIVADGSGAEATETAKWEAATRAGKALQVEVMVYGYRPDKDSPVWPLGKTFKIEAKAIGLDAELLITQVKFDLAETGHTTTLSLTRPDAYLPEPVKEGEGKGGASGGLPAGNGLPPGTVVYS